MIYWEAVITAKMFCNPETWKIAFFKWGNGFLKEEALQRFNNMYSGCGVEAVDVEIYQVDERMGERI